MPKKSSLYALALLLLALAASSITSFFASVYAHQFERHERAWKKGAEVSPQSWASSYSSLKVALSLEPYHPEYLQLMARLYSWRVWADLDEAGYQEEKWLLRSLVLRPYWANAWSSLVYQKSLQNQVDEEFWQAYQNALASGMWEREVLYNLLSAGANAWSQLNFGQRQEIIALFQRVAIFDKKIALRSLSIINSYGMKLAFCHSLKSLNRDTYLDGHCSLRRE